MLPIRGRVFLFASSMGDTPATPAMATMIPAMGDAARPILVVSTILSAYTYSSCCCSVFYNFMFRETNLKRDKNGTKPQENKVRNTIELHAPTVGITFSCTKVQICPVKNEQFYLFLSLTNTFSDYCTTRDNTSTFYIPVYPFSEYVYVKQCFHSFGQ